MRLSRVFIPLLSLSLVFSCKPQVPDEYLQPGEMEDILYDYHLADAMADGTEGSSRRAYDVTLYRQAVLEKYGITQAEFDSSLVYYTRHADRLHKIYENLTKRFEDEAMALGASANDIRQYGDMKSAKDTTNMWKGVPATMLLPYAPYNVMSFDFEADSTYHAGDRLIFSFYSDFLYRSGMKDATAMLAVQFKNDSVASKTVRMTSNANYSVTVSDDNRKGIKSVRGFIYLSDRKTTGDDDYERNNLRLMFVNNIRLVRMRANVIEQQRDGGDRNTARDTVSKRRLTPLNTASDAPAGNGDEPKRGVGTTGKPTKLRPIDNAAQKSIKSN